MTRNRTSCPVLAASSLRFILRCVAKVESTTNGETFANAGEHAANNPITCQQPNNLIV